MEHKTRFVAGLPLPTIGLIVFWLLVEPPLSPPSIAALTRQPAPPLPPEPQPEKRDAGQRSETPEQPAVKPPETDQPDRSAAASPS